MYNFKEFIAALNCKDFDVLEKKWLKFANKIIKDSVVAFKKGKHKGDCTKQPYLCDLCMKQCYQNLKNIHYMKKNIELIIVCKRSI
jgi:hypothetical protein